MAFALVSLIGIPPTGLFIGKIFLFTSAVQSGLAWLAVAGVVNSVISAYYYLRIVRLMYMGEPTDERKLGVSVPFGLALAVSAAAVLALGVAPRLITWLTDGAARGADGVRGMGAATSPLPLPFSRESGNPSPLPSSPILGED